jgi:glycosyltransferase involved in cell wall biosynthesis
MARADPDKWSSNTFKILGGIPYSGRRARLMGWSDRIQAKLGPAPGWCEVLPVGAESAQQFLSSLDCLLSVNGGARENWPRIGLEAMAAGVPVITQDAWGWREMVQSGQTGWLCGSDEEFCFRAAQYAYDEELRLRHAEAALKLVKVLTDPAVLWGHWRAVFSDLGA